MTTPTPPPIAPGPPPGPPQDPYQHSTEPPTNPYPQPAYAPPPPYAGPGPYPVAPQRKPHWWRDLGSGGQATVIVVAVLVPLVAILAGIGALVGDGSSDLDVELTKCEVSGQTASVEYRVTNNGSRTVDAEIEIEYRSNGARVDTDTSFVNNVPAGDSALGSESTFLPTSPTGLQCRARIA